MGFDGMSLGDVEIVLLMMLFLFVNVAEIHVFYTIFCVGRRILYTLYTKRFMCIQD